MSRARNNIAECADKKLRDLASKLLYEYGGKHYAEIRAAMAEAGFAGKLHASTLMAWMRSAEYLRYAAARENADNDAIRNSARAMNDGNGPRDALDVVVGEMAKGLYLQAMERGVADKDALQDMAKVLIPFWRTKIADDKTALQKRVDDLTAQLAAQDIAHENEVGTLREEADKAAAEIARLIGVLEAHGLKADGGAGQGLSAGTIANIKRLYGL